MQLAICQQCHRNDVSAQAAIYAATWHILRERLLSALLESSHVVLDSSSGLRRLCITCCGLQCGLLCVIGLRTLQTEPAGTRSSSRLWSSPRGGSGLPPPCAMLSCVPP